MAESSVNIYFAHSIKTYNSDSEKQLIRQIKTLFPKYKIVNPKDIQSHNMTDFYRSIQQCEILVFYGNTIGVISEIYFASLLKIPIYDLRTLKPVDEKYLQNLIKFYENTEYFFNDLKKMNIVRSGEE